MNFEQVLIRYRWLLTQQQYKTLRGLVRSGDVEGAKKGLNKLIDRYRRRTQKL